MISKKKLLLLSKLFAKPSAYAIPSIRILDKALIILTRIFYAVIIIFLRMIIGKRKEKNHNYTINSLFVLISVFHFISLCFSIR
jgi:hypothetical protein